MWFIHLYLMYQFTHYSIYTFFLCMGLMDNRIGTSNERQKSLPIVKVASSGKAVLELRCGGVFYAVS